METVKRLEIIVDSPEVPDLLRELNKVGVTGYTIFNNLSGSGDRGERRNDEPGGGSGNACILAAVKQERVDSVVAAIRPILRRRGGVCLISDAHWVIH
jgi:nitrogen regulatory protein PII